MAYYKTVYNGAQDAITKISDFTRTVESRLGWISTSDTEFLKIKNLTLDMGFEIKLGVGYSGAHAKIYKVFRPKGGEVTNPSYGAMASLGQSGTLHVIITADIFFYALEDSKGLCFCNSFGKLKTKNSTPDAERPAVYWSPSLGYNYDSTISNMFADSHGNSSYRHLYVCDEDSSDIFLPAVVPLHNIDVTGAVLGYISSANNTSENVKQFLARDLYLPVSGTHILMTPMFAASAGTVYGSNHTFGYGDSGGYITSSLEMITGATKEFNGVPHFYFKGKIETTDRGFGYVVRAEVGDAS